MFRWKRRKRERSLEEIIRIREILEEARMKYRIYCSGRFLANSFLFPAYENFTEIRFR